MASLTDGHFFRGGRWVIDLNERDAIDHLNSINLHKDEQLIMNYFIYFLFVDKEKLGANEFSERHEDIKDGILAIMNRKYDLGSKQLCTVIEGIVTKSLLNDGCIDNETNPKWIGSFHKNPKPTNFFAFLEGALIDPRSRIGRSIQYPPESEIYHVSEMIRNPLAHGSRTLATLRDYNVLFFILILLFHDIVNPHRSPLDHKYYEWISRTSRNMRLKGEEPNLEKVLALGDEKKLDLEKVKRIYREITK